MFIGTTSRSDIRQPAWSLALMLGKRLPICVVSAGPPLKPLTIPEHPSVLIPRGGGNKEITAAAPFLETARGVAS
jgi:hypothetical protein